MSMKLRAADRVLDKETAARAAAVRSYKVKGDFAVRDNRGTLIQVKCRLCGTPIVDWAEASRETEVREGGIREVRIKERLMQLSSFATVPMVLDNGTYHTFNMCTECAKNFDDQDEGLLEACLCADFEDWGRGAEITGVDLKAYNQRMKELHRAKVVKGRKK